MIRPFNIEFLHCFVSDNERDCMYDSALGVAAAHLSPEGERWWGRCTDRESRKTDREAETEGGRERELIGVFEPIQPLGSILGLKETFLKRHTVERTKKAELRPQEQSEKTESCRENLWNQIQLKGHKDRNRPKNRIKKRVGKLGWFMLDIYRNIPTTRRRACRDVL